MEPTDITLRLKHARVTILLSTDPLTPFSDIQSQLLSVLQERYTKGLPSPSLPGKYIPLPTSASDITFAVPRAAADPSKGWKQMRLDGSGGIGTRKGKGGKNKDVKLPACPKSLEVQDGGVLAFRFRDEDEEEDGESEDSYNSLDELEKDELEDDDDEREEKPKKRVREKAVKGREEEGRFVVEWPSYEENYGDQMNEEGKVYGEGADDDSMLGDRLPREDEDAEEDDDDEEDDIVTAKKRRVN